jgi:hypothetical protein
MFSFATHGKSIVAFAVAVLTAVSTAAAGGHLGATEKVQVAVAVASAVGVYLVPAVPQWPWMKTAVAGLLAALNLAVSLLANQHGLASADYINLVIAALGVVAVHIAPAMSATAKPAVAPKA